MAIVASYLQYGYLAGATQPFLVAGIKVPIWHLLWLGFWTGYVMGLVGEASGIFSLPYTISVLHFSNVSITPTSLITTFLNPLGALLGYWRGNQWNLDLAMGPCIGAVFGSFIGPFVRINYLQDEIPFKTFMGCILLFMGLHLLVQITPWYIRKKRYKNEFNRKYDAYINKNNENGKITVGLPKDFKITTINKSFLHVEIEYWGIRQKFSMPALLLIGFVVGIVSSAFGVGGGFMLVPIMVTFFGLPIYVLVAAAIPFVLVLSATSLISYIFTLPLLTGVLVEPDWSFGLFIASGAILGAWVASKTQKYVPEIYLKSILGGITAIVGCLYIINYFWTLPFKV